MPIYDYHCTACGADVELMQKISEPPATQCPECGKPELVKQISAAGFRLSGGGWYETDFKAGNKKNLADKDGKAEKSDKSDKSDKSGEAKKAEPAKPAAAEKPASGAKGEAAA